MDTKSTKSTKSTKRAKPPKRVGRPALRQAAEAQTGGGPPDQATGGQGPPDQKITRTKKPGAEVKRLKVTLVRSTIGFGKKQAAVVLGLGLRRPHHTVELLDTPGIRGMIFKVRHLVEVN